MSKKIDATPSPPTPHPYPLDADDHNGGVRETRTYSFGLDIMRDSPFFNALTRRRSWNAVERYD